MRWPWVWMVIHILIKWHSYIRLAPRLRGIYHINGLVQEWGNSIANALELQQSFTKPLIYLFIPHKRFCWEINPIDVQKAVHENWKKIKTEKYFRIHRMRYAGMKMRDRMSKVLWYWAAISFCSVCIISIVLLIGDYLARFKEHKTSRTLF